MRYKGSMRCTLATVQLYNTGKILQKNKQIERNIYNHIKIIHVNRSYTYTYYWFFIINSYK